MIKKESLKEFEGLVDKCFGKLETEYGFKKVNAQFQRHEWWINFENRTTHVSVGYEIGSVPWVLIGDAKNPRLNGSSLEWLLVELGIEKMPPVEVAFEKKQYTQKDIESILENKGQQLFMYATDLLRGNFKIVPKLQERGKKFAEECNEYMMSQSRKKKSKTRRGIDIMPNKHTFTATIQNAGGGGAFVEVPFDVETAFGSKRPKVKAMIEGIPYRGTLVRMGTECHLLLILKEIREKAGKTFGDEVKITVEADVEPRVIEIPAELKKVFVKEKEAKAIFDKLSYTHQKENVTWITEAKRDETRQRRVAKTIEMLKKDKKSR